MTRWLLAVLLVLAAAAPARGHDYYLNAGNSGTAVTLAFANASVQRLTLTANTALTFASGTTAGFTCTVILSQDATGGRTVTWPASVTWIGGVSPTIGSAANAVTLVSFLYDGTTWYGWLPSPAPTGGGGSVPSGAIVLIDSGTCPSGFAEDSTLSGQMVYGTVAANANVGTAAGSNSITPAGSVAAPTFTGSSGTVPAEAITYPANVPAFSGSSGTVPAEVISYPANVPVFTGTSNEATSTFTATTAKFSTSGSGTAADTSTSHSHTITPSGTVAWPTNPPTNGTVAFTPAGTIAWPANPPTNGTVAFTPAGTNSAPAFTGTAFDPHPAFTRVIFCKKS